LGVAVFAHNGTKKLKNLISAFLSYHLTPFESNPWGCYNNLAKMLTTSQNLSDFSLILSLICLFLIGFLFWEVRALNQLRKSFFTGRSGRDMETVLMELARKLQQVEDEKLVLEQGLAGLAKKSELMVQKICVYRFNPFADGGGNFSFTLAVLDGYDNGIVLTSMHGREQNRIYAKKISAGKAETQLTEEEQMAIASAQTKNN